ncbi:AraC family transcriptional regulator [Vibrio profundum]|uniref:AraC family transcriptional regulator n=1 Tax=Vibrio profundum TaxID=2910247 RepID=UPI003D148C20
MQHEKADYKTIDIFNGMEMVKAEYKHQSFSKHVHEGYTIGLIETGAQRFYRSGSTHVAGQESIILVNADDVHNGECATSNGWKYSAIYPTPADFEALSFDLTGSKSITPYFTDSVIQDQKITSQLRLIFECISNNESLLLIEPLIYGTLINLVSAHGRPIHRPPEQQVNLCYLQRAKEFIHTYAKDSISLDQLATISDCSKYHFIRQFSKRFGLSPHAYQTQVKLQKAKDLLKSGQSISHVATDCGFYDQSHLSRHFKRTLGTTPKSFQKSNFIQ